MVEFALVLPLLLLVMLGLIEVGRLLFMYSVVFTSVREASRYGSAAGYLSGGRYQYQDCAGIRAAAKRVGTLANIQDNEITITYDRLTDSGVSPLGSCPVGGTGPSLTLGNRVTVHVSTNYSPIVPIPNLPSFPITATSSRTILKNISIQGTPVVSDTTLPLVSFSSAGRDVTEGNLGDSTDYTVSVVLNDIATENISVNFSISGSATQGVDYTINDSSPIIIPSGYIEKEFVITVIGDNLSEYNETLVLTIESTVNAELGVPYIYQMTINDDDGQPVVTFTSASQSNPESLPNLSVVAQLSNASGMDVEVPFNVTGSASVGGDFTITGSPLIIPAGSTSQSIAITVVPDTVFEPDETVIVTMETPINAVAGAITQHTATITDDDSPPVLSFVSESQLVPEAIGTVLATVHLVDSLGTEVPAGVTITVPFSASGTASPTTDYTISPSPLTIPAGSSRADVVIYLEQDGVVEQDETIEIALGTPDFAMLGSPSTHTATITHDPTVFFTLESQSVQESGLAVDIAVQVLPAPTADVSIPFSLVGSAVQGEDYIAMDSSPLYIPAGGSQTILSLSITSDVLDELDETVEVRLGAPTNALLGSPNRHVVNIVDDDAAPAIFFVQANQSIDEAAVSVQAQVQLSAVSSLPVTVPLSLSGNAMQGSDYTFTQTSVVIPAGSLGADLSVQILDDVVPELVETVVLVLEQPTNAVLGTPGTHSISILPSDQPTCEINTSSPLSIPVGGTSLEWTLTNTGTDVLQLKQLTVSWPTGTPDAPKFEKVSFGGNQIFVGNRPHSPSTVTWIIPHSAGELTGSASVLLNFTRMLDPGTYRLILVFYNVTQNYECSPVSGSRNF